MEKSTISHLSYVDPTSQIGENVRIEPFAYVGPDVVVGDNCIILQNATLLQGTTLGNDNVVYQNAVIGASPQNFKSVGEQRYVTIGHHNMIRENVVIAGGPSREQATSIGSNNRIMEAAHICHLATIGDNCVVGIQSLLADACSLHDHVLLSNSVLVQSKARVGQFALVQSGTRVCKDVPPYIILSGNPNKYHGVNAEILKRKEEMSERILRHIANAYRLVYQNNTSLIDACKSIDEQVPKSAEIDAILSFLTSSEKGIVR